MYLFISLNFNNNNLRRKKYRFFKCFLMKKLHFFRVNFFRFRREEKTVLEAKWTRHKKAKFVFYSRTIKPSL